MNEDTNDTAQIVSIGRTFRQARERLGLDIKQAADAIHLNDSVIKALEAEDFDRLPSQVFVRGYIRSYAKLLELDDKPLLAAHRQSLPEEQSMPPEAVSVEIKKPQPGLTYKGDPILLWTMILFISVTAGFALAWWINQDNSDPAPLASVVEPTDAPKQQLDPQAELPAALTQVAESQQQQPDPQQRPDPVEPDIEPQQELAVAQAHATVAPPLAVNQFTLSLRMSGKSWMEVVDQDRNRILYGLYTAGTIETFTATGQLNIFLGNAPAVEVWLDDELLDHSAYMYANNVARFDINQAGLVAPSIN